MTQFNPFIMLKRLVVIKGQVRAYDEYFHEGVNIIRGTNSSGKSTIADFIFYGLGGDLTKLKNEAKLCNFVFCEVELSGNVFTLKREIKEGGRKSMDIFSGNFDEAIKSELTNWSRHPYNADKKESFYQVIFKELGIPYSRSDDKNSITMHQLLRMMYVDQMTSPDRLFRFDNFDSAAKREAIGELLVGLSDFTLYEKRVALQLIEPKLDNLIKEIKTIHSFLGDSVISLEEIDKEILGRQSKIDEIEKELESGSLSKESEGDEENNEIKKITESVREKRSNYNYLQEEIAKANFEITDSKLFIESLKGRLCSLKETKQIINVLSDVAFNHCPACQSKVEVKGDGCNLCGTNSQDNGSEYDPTFKVRKELEFQIAESNKLIDYKYSLVEELKIQLSQESTVLTELLRELEFIKKPQIQVSLEIRRKISKIGALKNQIKDLNNSKEKYSKLYNTYAERSRLQYQVIELKNEIQRLEAKSTQAFKDKKRRLSENTLSIIREDNHHEEVFSNGKSVQFDFAEDRVAIDDRALFSASSMVFLKNSFRVALLKASCEDPSYLYPRFLLMDNIEDKGMEEERSQLFQRLIIKLSKDVKVKHQIIFTTSMIDPALDNSSYCVGEFYHSGNKSLKYCN